MIFDPARMSYRKLLEFFFQVHDPTTRNRQGNDVGMSYRSAIYYHQRRAEAGRRGHDRRRERVGALAGPRRHRGRAGGPVLGGRARAPGLPAAHPERLHLPLRAAGLEAAGARSREASRHNRPMAEPELPNDALGKAIAALEAQRPVLGSAIVDAALAPLLAQQQATPSHRAAAAAPGVGAVPRRGRLDRPQPDHRSRGPARHHGLGAAVVQRPGGGARRQGPAVRRRQPARRLRRRDRARRRRRACRARRPRPAGRGAAAGRADRAHPRAGRLPGAGRHPHRPRPARRRRRRRRHDPRLHRQHRRPARADGAARKPAHQPGDLAPCARRVRLRGAAAAAGQGAGRAAAHLARAARQAARLSRRHPRHRRHRDAAGRARRRAGAAGRGVRGDARRRASSRP